MDQESASGIKIFINPYFSCIAAELPLTQIETKQPHLFHNYVESQMFRERVKYLLVIKLSEVFDISISTTLK